jgi:type II secretory pathway pseudopilin PulG
LPELLALLAIVGVLAVIAIPSFSDAMDDYRLASSANLIASELQTARMLAVSRGAVFDIELNTGDRTVQVVDPEDPENPPRAAKELEKGVNLIAAPDPPVRFFPRGHARGGWITLQNEDGEVVSVQVQTSGKVTIEHYYGGYRRTLR